MAGDDLDAPLGYSSDKDALPVAVRGEIAWGLLALGGIGLIGVSLAAFVVVTDSQKAGMPQALATLEPVQPRKIAVPELPPAAAAVPRDSEGSTSVGRSMRASGPQVDMESGVKVVRRGAADMPDALIIRVPPEDLKTSLAPAPDARLVVAGPHGPLPRIGRDGARPADIYARPVVLGARLSPQAPRIALVITGMGVNEAATDRALGALPPAVTFAFAPYGAQVAQQAERARDDGHELLLQVPMEGFGSGDGGARMLPAHAPRDKIVDALHWHMSRFPGYIGITHFLGGRFMSVQPAIASLLQDVADRGLVFLDDGSSQQSLAASAAAAIGAPMARADVLIDAAAKPEAMDAALRRLETLARERGSAIGIASAMPLSVDRIARFAQGLEARGMALVPVSALINAPARTSSR